MKLSREGHILRLTDLSGVESDAILAVIVANPDAVPAVSYAESIESGGEPTAITEVTIDWTTPPPPPES